ncbi:hypothetical protein [Flavobacterium mekongense]|uniref:hypothetical protein n=1 Tax=Flavobacterium mekongense TaxID=3379707 RepID=UPI00399B8BCA
MRTLIIESYQKVELVRTDLESIVNSLHQNSNGLSSGEIALIASAIGATAAILSQVIIFLLNRSKERSGLKKELIAEERRLAFLLNRYHEEYVGYLTLSKFFAKASDFHTGESNQKSLDKHFDYDQRSRETLSKRDVTQSDYFKKIIHFTTLIKPNIVIEEELEKIRSYIPRKTDRYKDCNTQQELYNAQELEYQQLCIVYDYYKNCYDTINLEMRKNL